MSLLSMIRNAAIGQLNVIAELKHNQKTTNANYFTVWDS
jgi:hypothetical protein